MRKEGNPTRSEEVNNMIKKVRKFEVRHEGVARNTRPLEYEEFKNVVKEERNNVSDNFKKYQFLSVITMQWMMIARVDDMMKWKFNSLSNNVTYPFNLLIKMKSKNITEEREVSEQINGIPNLSFAKFSNLYRIYPAFHKL